MVKGVRGRLPAKSTGSIKLESHETHLAEELLDEGAVVKSGEMMAVGQCR